LRSTSQKSSFRFTFWVLLAFAAGSGRVIQAQPAASTTSLAVTSGANAVTSVSAGTVVTLTASVVSNSLPVTPGLVKFCDASAAHCEDIHIVGTAQLTSAGTAVIKFRPGLGSHSYKAVFAGTIRTASSTSATATLTVTGPPRTATAITQSGSVGDYTLVATVGGLASSGPTGTVSILDSSDGNAVRGTAELSASTPGLSFLNSSNPATGQYSYSIAEGDFNRDGIPDLAVTNTANNNLTILLGDGSGGFTPTAKSPVTGANPFSVAAGDFNGDGILDLAVANFDYSGAVTTTTILLGNGDGTFTAAPASPAEGANAGFIVTGDFNRDGILDLAVLNIPPNSAPGTVTILLGHGNGTFSPAASSPATGDSPYALAIGDFNGDGVQDLAVTNYIGKTVTILLGNGDGTFTPTAVSPATDSNPTSIAAGDFNGDGILDLAVTNYGTSGVTILMGNGDGTFTRKASSPATGSNPCSVAIGDFNGDGIPDLAVANNGGKDLTVVLGNGDGTFTATPAGAQFRSNPQFVAAGDFNGDGRTDLAVAVAYPSADGDLVMLLAENQTATVIVSGIAVAPPATGTHAVVASYQGDSNNAASTSPAIGLTAAKGIPAVSVAAPANPTTYGDPTTLTATVTGSGLMPTGTVNFLDGSIELGMGTLNASGVAIFNAGALAVGSHSITVEYGGDSNYIASPSAAYSLTVNRVTPTIVWAHPKAIAYGTLLSGAQLDAQAVNPINEAAVSGTFKYVPALGTKLAPGPQTLSVTFSPSDTADYTSLVTKTVPLTVTKARQTIDFAAPKTPVVYGAKPMTLVAKTSSGLRVAFIVVSGPGKVTGDILTIGGAGKIEIAARQEGDGDYDAAPEVIRTIVVEQAKLKVSANDLSMKEGSKVPTLTYRITGFVNDDTQKTATTGDPRLTTTATSTSKPGNYPITVIKGNLDSRNYAFEFEDGILAVVK